VPFHASIKYIWACPASLLGLALAAFAELAGASTAIVGGVVEVTLTPRKNLLRRLARRGRFSAITFGHVVIAASAEDQAVLRSHERVHFTQYERWGPVLLLAYPAESVFQFLRGRRPYLDNRFEVQARRHAMLSPRPAVRMSDRADP
jgi:hypothetical protein